jgi:hypothetical protein
LREGRIVDDNLLRIVNNYEAIDINTMFRGYRKGIVSSLISSEAPWCDLHLNTPETHVNRDNPIETLHIIVLFVGGVLLFDPPQELPIDNK